MTDAPVILITRFAPLKYFGELSKEARFIQGPSSGMMPRDEVLRRAGEANVVVNSTELRVDEEFLDAAPRLKLVANLAAGYNNLDLELLSRRGVWAANCPDEFTEATAEWTIGLLLNVARNGIEADNFVRSGRWRLGTDAFDQWNRIGLAGKTLGIIGYGRIGRAVATRARAFGMRVVYFNRSSVDEPDYRPLDQLLAESDVVSMHVPLTDETRHLINRARLAKMKRGALFLNVSRGRTVDEKALADALHSGHLNGAGLDVFENEPEPHPDLLSAPKTVFSPHFAAGTPETIAAAWSRMVKNIVRVFRGEPPIAALNTLRRPPF